MTQNHIHLSLVLEDEGTEFAPDIKWKVTKRSKRPRIFSSLKYGITGDLRAHVLTDDTGVVRYSDLSFEVVISEYEGYTADEREELLEAMHGEFVYFVDLKHEDDGEDHSADVRLMFVAEVGELQNWIADLSRHYVSITLIDASRI